MLDADDVFLLSFLLDLLLFRCDNDISHNDLLVDVLLVVLRLLEVLTGVGQVGS
jgi:hypothetical protein